MSSKIPTISFSQIGVAQRCWKRWEYSYVLELSKIDTTPQMRKGTYCHEMLAVHYQGGNWRERFSQLVTEIGQDHEELTILTHAAQIVPTYIEWATEADKLWQILDVELEFEVPMETPSGREYIAHGFIDLVYKNIATGKVGVVDHKTTSAPNGVNRVSAEAFNMSLQLPFYAQALRKLGLDVDHCIYNMISTFPYKNSPGYGKLFNRIKTYRSKQELETMTQEIGMMVDLMLRDDIPRYRSLSTDCMYCPFLTPCDMELKGMNPKPILLTQYVPRDSRRSEKKLEKIETPQQLHEKKEGTASIGTLTL